MRPVRRTSGPDVAQKEVLSPERQIIAWGSYDTSKPRVRLLLDELRARDMLLAEINAPVWTSVRDKAVAKPRVLLKALWRLLLSYPGALAKLARWPSGKSVLLPYPAIPDIFLAWPVARMRRHTIIADAFISLHDTIVSDRGLVDRKSFGSKLIWRIEWLALRLADVILVDTDQHGDFFAQQFGIARSRFQTVLVGAEPAFWAMRNQPGEISRHPLIDPGRLTVLFYGQLIPLHGVDTILDAIAQTTAQPFCWLLVGSGQDEARVQRFLDKHAGDNVRWVPWVDYEQLPALVSAAAVGLGIFGTGDKAARVIPNKVFQILAAGKPVITRASPAVDAIASRYPGAIVTVPAGNSTALAEAVRKLLRDPHEWRPVPPAAEAELGPAGGLQALQERSELG